MSKVSAPHSKVTRRQDVFLAYGFLLSAVLLTAVVTRFPSNAWLSGFTKNYLAIHIVLEFCGILISLAVFTVGWATYQNVRSLDILLVSLASFAMGWLDLGHTLTFTGMPEFIGPSGPNQAIEFWLASRLTGAACLLGAAILHQRNLQLRRLNFWAVTALAVTVLWTAAWFDLILFRAREFPIMYVPGSGLTPLKIGCERFCMGLSFVAGVLFLSRAEKHERFSYRWMGCASLLFAISGFYFTIYREFDDLYVFVGHLFKAAAFIMVYRAVFVECVSSPYEKMRLMAAHAADANASKSRFLANVSHEFRTPLGVITGFSDLLVDSPLLDPESRRWSEMIGRNSRQLRLLIDDLLDLSKAESESISMQWSDFDLRAIITEVIAGLQLQAEQKQIKIVWLGDIGRRLVIRSDEMRLRQILVNVIGNAVKFTSDGEVKVQLEVRPGEPLRVFVRDSGIGIEASQVHRLFQPFAQADNPLNRRFGGTGLGLALAKKMARLLGGDLTLDESELNRGSLFCLSLPGAKAHFREAPVDGPAETPAPVRLSPPSLGHVRILAAEDSPDNQALLEHYLSPTRAKLSFANNGAEALERTLRETFDIVLMDIQMPEMDGFEATLKLRENGWQGTILALTAHAHKPERERALSGGFDGYLVKPITRERLWAALLEHVDGFGRRTL